MREDYWLETSLAFVGYNIKDYHFAFVWYYHYFLRLQLGLSLGFCGLQQGLSLGFCSLQQWLSLFVRLSQTLWSIGLKRSRLLAEKKHIWRKSHCQALLIFFCRKLLNIDLDTLKIKRICWDHSRPKMSQDSINWFLIYICGDHFLLWRFSQVKPWSLQVQLQCRLCFRSCHGSDQPGLDLTG